MTILIAALAACGVFLILWTIFEALLLPLPGEDTLLVVYLRGDAAHVQQSIRACRWLRERRGIYGQVLLVDCQLKEEARKAAELMICSDDTIKMCKGTELADYLRLESTEVGAGTDQRDDSRSSISEL